MKRGILKIRKIRLTVVLILFISFLFPLFTFAYNTNSILSAAKSFGYDTSTIEGYLNAGKNAGIDLSSTTKIKEYLDKNVRVTAKQGFEVTKTGLETIINGPDKLFDYDIPGIADKKRKAREALDQLSTAEKQTFEKIDNTLGQINKAESVYGLMNTVGKIPAVLGLIDDIKNLGKGDANPAQIIQTLERVGSLVGFTIPSEFKQGIGMISGMGNGIMNSASSLQGVLGGFANSNRVPSQITGASAGASGMMAEVVGAGGQGVKSVETVNSASEQMSENNNIIKDGQETGQNVCNNSQNSQGDSGSNGVPVIEQAGALLGYTKQLANMTTQTRHITQKICEDTEKILAIQKDLLKKEREDDPEAAKEAREAIKKERDDYQKFMKEGRTPSNDIGQGPTKNMVVTLKEWVQESKEVANNLLLYLLDSNKSQIPEGNKTLIAQAIGEQVEIKKDEEAFYLASTKPTIDTKASIQNPPQDPSQNFSNLFEIADSRNNGPGQFFINLDIKNKFEEEYKSRAEQTWAPFGGITAVTECINSFEYDGKKHCTDESILIAAKLVADRASLLNDAPIHVTLNTDESEEDKRKDGVSPLSSGSGGSSVSGVTMETSGGQTSGGGGGATSGGGGSAGGTSGGTDWLSYLSQLFSGLSGADNDEPDQSYGDEEIYYEPEAPTLKIESNTEDLKNGIKKTEIFYEAENSISCMTKTDWPTWSTLENGKHIASTTKTILIQKDEDFESNIIGTFDIYHPSIFTYEISASGEGGTIVQIPTNTFTIGQNTLTQTLTYKPNITGLSANDSIFLTLNGYSLNIQANLTDETPDGSDIVNRLWVAITSETDHIKKEEFKKYTVSSSGDTLTIKRTTGTFDRNYTYRMSCINEAGEQISKFTTINLLP